MSTSKVLKILYWLLIIVLLATGQYVFAGLGIAAFIAVKVLKGVVKTVFLVVISIIAVIAIKTLFGL